MPTQILHRKRAMRKASGWLATVALGLLGLAQLEPQLNRALAVTIPPWVFDWVVLAAMIGLSSAVLMWGVGLLPEVRREPVFVSGWLQLSEIPALRRFAVGYFDESFASEQKLQEWLSRRRDCITVVRRLVRSRLTTRTDIRAFFILLPLTRSAVELYKRNEITGATFLKEHIATSGEDTWGVYVAAIAGIDPQARNSALLLLHSALEQHGRQGTRVALARPTTPRGKELAEEFAMKPIPGTELGGNPLYEREWDGIDVSSGTAEVRQPRAGAA